MTAGAAAGPRRDPDVQGHFTGPDPDRRPRASVLIPAHDEERTIGRLLGDLASAHQEGRLEVVVVCNGCTDATATVARSYGVTVLDLEEPGKSNALTEGEKVARGEVVVYLDADVEISAASVETLVAAVEGEQVLAAGPRRRVPRTGVARPVAWYYDVWESLPSVREGLFGRGVIALSARGAERVRALPPAMSDDLAVSEAFAPHERRVVDGVEVVVHPPRTVADLVRRRTRVVTGNVQADGSTLRRPSSRTGGHTLVALVRTRPYLAPKVAVFLAVGLVARARARRAVRAGDFSTWERDESSRQAG